MTARQLYEYSLFEINKVEAPTLLVEEYNYFINKAVLQYVNLKYNTFDVNQQMTDDLGVLKGIAILTDFVKDTLDFHGATFTTTLPVDYFHLLSCLVQYTVTKTFKCYKPTQPVTFGATRLAAGMSANIENNYYLRPSYKKPYFIVYDGVDVLPPVNPSANVPEVPVNVRASGGVTKKMQIKYGRDTSLFQLSKVQLEYLKVPREILITQEQIDITEDTSQELEFPDYVCQEIIKELVKLLLENSSDPRLQTNIPVNQTIATPGQGEQQQGKRR